MGGVAAGAVAEAAAKFAIFLLFAFPAAVMIGSMCLLLIIALVDRGLMFGGRIVAVAAAATAVCTGAIAVMAGAAYLLSSMFGSSEDWVPATVLAAIWLALVGWQLALAVGIFYRRDVSADPRRP